MGHWLSASRCITESSGTTVFVVCFLMEQILSMKRLVVVASHQDRIIPVNELYYLA